MNQPSPNPSKPSRRSKEKPSRAKKEAPVAFLPTEVDLDPVSTMVLKRAITESRETLARKELAPGVYPVNEVVYFSGELTVDEPTEARATANLLSMDTVAFLLYSLGVKGPEALAFLRAAAERTLSRARGEQSDVTDQVQIYSTLLEGFKTEFEKMVESLPKQKRAGAIRYKGKAVRLSGVKPTVLRT